MNQSNEKKLEEKFKEAFDEHFDEIPYYQDMNYTTEFDIGKLMHSRTNKKMPKYRKLKVAGIIFAFLICSSAFGIAINNGTVEAGKDGLLNFFYSITGNDHKISNQPVSLEVLDLEDEANVDKAKDLIPNLFMDNEILDGYKFDHMYIEKIDNTNITSLSQYYKDDNEVIINQSIVSDDYKITMEDYEEEIKINDGTLYTITSLGNENGLNCTFFIKGNETVEVIGKIDLALLKTFTEQEILKKYK